MNKGALFRKHHHELWHCSIPFRTTATGHPSKNVINHHHMENVRSRQLFPDYICSGELKMPQQYLKQTTIVHG